MTCTVPCYGLGTAMRILRHLLPDCQLTAIDIDPEIVQLARDHILVKRFTL